MDWLSPQHLFLLAAPAAMVLAALALAAGQRRAEARRARESLGRPLRRVAEATEGQRVLLEGTLDTLEAPCARFEDGAPCAAATVETTGPRAAPGSIPATWKPAPGVGLARRARASALVLTVGADRVSLEGPVEVFVGSRETDPGTPFASLARAVRERITSAADPAPLPGAGPLPASAAGAGPLPASTAALDADRARHAIPLFRSLAAGDRVRAAGVLAKQSEGDRTGYRDRARWALQGDASDPIVLAYAGTPRHRGAFASVLGGVRGVPLAPAAVAVALVAGLTTGAFAVLNRPRPMTDVAPALADPNPPVRAFADPARCASLQKEHQTAAQTLAVCEEDDQCTTDLRGGAHFGLESCYRFRNRTLSPARADAAERAWLDEGCATSYEICPPAPPAMCREGRCVERPPRPRPHLVAPRGRPRGLLPLPSPRRHPERPPRRRRPRRLLPGQRNTHCLRLRRPRRRPLRRGRSGPRGRGRRPPRARLAQPRRDHPLLRARPLLPAPALLPLHRRRPPHPARRLRRRGGLRQRLASPPVRPFLVATTTGRALPASARSRSSASPATAARTCRSPG
jgi:hypothetical protein